MGWFVTSFHLTPYLVLLMETRIFYWDDGVDYIEIIKKDDVWTRLALLNADLNRLNRSIKLRFDELNGDKHDIG